MTNDPQPKIAQHWNADFALAFVSFLESIIGAVWERHGHEMYTLIEQRADRIRVEQTHADKRHAEIDAQIPF